MSQYPYPPQYPPYYGMPWPTPDTNARGRRAAILLFVIGGLIAVYSTCNGISALLSTPQMLSENPFMSNQQLPVSPQSMRTMTVVASCIMLGYGISLISCGVGVRVGRRGPTIAALVFSGIGVLVLGMFLLLSVIAALMNPILALFACVVVVPLALLILQIVWLFQALQASPTPTMGVGYPQGWVMMQPMPPGFGQPGQASYGYGYGYPPAQPGGAEQAGPPGANLPPEKRPE